MSEIQKFGTFLAQNKRGRCRSQLDQDFFVLYELKKRRNGFFVEFGASDGLLLSNTYLLEKEFGWNGILAEPAKTFHKPLRENRNCAIDYRCVWKRSGELLDFSESSLGELSTIAGEFSRIADIHAYGHRKESARYQVETVSLNDLLKAHSAPKEIEYISVDTEGSEYDIMASFDFDKYDVKIFTIEHNFHHTPSRQNVRELMISKGYEQQFETLTCWDDWYVKRL